MHSFSAIFILVAVARSSLGVTFNVSVGANMGLTFSPNTVSGANPGDTVNFQFQAKNHSVTQSTFANPCQQSGLSSPFEFVSDPNTPLLFSLTVNDTTPSWYFCAQTQPVDHCQMGMVFAINPTVDKTFAMFQSTAMGTSGSASNVSSSAGASPSSSAAPNAIPSAIPSGMQTLVSTQGDPTPVATATNTITTTDASATSDPASSSSAAANSGLKTVGGAPGLLWVAGAFLGWVL